MAKVTRHIRASRSEVFKALIRPETYPGMAGRVS